MTKLGPDKPGTRQKLDKTNPGLDKLLQDKLWNKPNQRQDMPWTRQTLDKTSHGQDKPWTRQTLDN
jgi:hypothetical protein